MLTQHNICTRYSTAILLTAGILCTACGRRREAQLPPHLHPARDAAKTEDWQAAHALLLEATEAYPETLTTQMNLAMLQWRTGKLNDAIATFNNIINRDAVPAIVWEYYAQLQLDAGNPHATRELLQNVEPPSARSLTLNAMADINMQNFERAKFALENALELDATFAPAWYHLALLYRDHLPNRIEAQIAFRNFQSHAPQHPMAQKSHTVFLGQPLPDPVPAGEEETLATTTTDRVSMQPDIEERMAKVQHLMDQGDTDAALMVLKEAVERHPNNPDAVWALAQFYDQQLELTDRADGLYNTFLQLFPNDPRISQIPRRARMRQATQRPTGDESVRQALLFQQGIEHYNREEWDAAITAFRRVLAIAPQDAGAAFNLGLTYHKVSDLDAAAAAFRQALEHEPDMIKSLYMLGLTERDRNNTPEALHLLNRVIRMQPDFAKAHQVLGRIYLREGRPDMTAIHFQRILDIDPQTDEARRAREWLDRQQNPR